MSLTTKNHARFSFMGRGNRVVDSNHVKKIETKIKTIDLTSMCPILCYRGKNGKLLILDGQHRFQACKNLGLPVHYHVIKKNKKLADLIFQLNSGNKKHNLEDKLKIQKDFGNKIIRKVFNLKKTYATQIGLGTVAQLLFSFGNGGQVSRALDRKTYKINYEVEFKRLVKFINDLPLPDWKWNASFIYAITDIHKKGKTAISKAKHHPWSREQSPKMYKEQFYDCTGIKV